MVDRERNVDIEKIENIDELSEKIGNKISNITEEAVDKANKILNIYGMRAEMQIVIKENKRES